MSGTIFGAIQVSLYPIFELSKEFSSNFMIEQPPEELFKCTTKREKKLISFQCSRADAFVGAIRNYFDNGMYWGLQNDGWEQFLDHLFHTILSTHSIKLFFFLDFGNALFLRYKFELNWDFTLVFAGPE